MSHSLAIYHIQNQTIKTNTETEFYIRFIWLKSYLVLIAVKLGRYSTMKGIFILCDIENKLVKLTSYLIIGNISKA